MPNLVSPGVLIQERDLSAPQSAPFLENVAAIVGPFVTGPVNTITTITSENQLRNIFGKPNDNNYDVWLMASSYLSYGGTLAVVRPSGTGSTVKNAVSTSYVSTGGTIDFTYGVGRSVGSASTSILIENQQIYDSTYLNKNDNTWHFAARYAGVLGNSIGVSVVDRGPDVILSLSEAFADAPGIGTTIGSGNTVGVVYSYDATNKTVTVFNTGTSQFEANYIFGTGETVTSVSDWYTSSKNYAMPPVTLGNGTKIPGLTWAQVAARPGTSTYAQSKGGENDEVNIFVYDKDGGITGTPNTRLETYTKVSKANDAKLPEGDNNYLRDAINARSSYVYWGKNIQTGFDPVTYASVETSNLGTGATSNFTIIGNNIFTISLGTDNQSPDVGTIEDGYKLFSSVEEVSIDYILPGKSFTSETDEVTKSNALISLAESRKDCIAFISPHIANVIGVASSDTQTTNIVNYFNKLPSSSYAVFDSGVKYIYDRFNDKYRYIGCAGDVAGLLASASINQQPWFSPAGYSRGQIKNANKLAYTPNKSQRDTLYLARINPITSFPGQGIVLFGDKTALSSPSAFDRINVRKLFLVLEKTIQQAANQQLFELNDEYTRNAFKGFVEPYLRDVQSKRGVTDFLVVCDETNNTPEVIDRNEFRADIYIKPTRSINYIYLTFVATRTGVSFQQVVGTV